AAHRPGIQPQDPPRQEVAAPEVVEEPPVEAELGQAPLDGVEVEHCQGPSRRSGRGTGGGLYRRGVRTSKTRVGPGSGPTGRPRRPAGPAGPRGHHWSWALPVMGTNRTGSRTSRSRLDSVLVIRTRFCTPRPIGATRRPPTLS